MKNVTCNKCGWVHFQVSREHAVKEVQRFGEYFESLTQKERDDYYGNRPSYIQDYETCNFCGNSYRNFRDSIEGDCPIGCTIGPIIDRSE